jgi:hypothetical protein
MRYKCIIILVPEPRVRSWTATLGQVLQARLSLPVLLRRLPLAVQAATDLPLERFERWIAGPAKLNHAQWIMTEAIPLTDAEECKDSLVISALECNAEVLRSALGLMTLLIPFFHHAPRLTGVFPALLDREPPSLQVGIIAGGEMRWLNWATVALPDRELTPRALTTLLARTIVLLRNAVDRCLNESSAPGEPAPVEPQPTRMAVPRLRRVVATYLPKIGHRLMNRLRGDDWCIAYRRCGTGGGLPDIETGSRGLTEIKSEIGRFYADPILFRHDDTTAIFFEDFDYGTNRAKISCAILNADGSYGAPREALARPYHLSYPFILTVGGTVLMVPETSANRTVELYEAVRFPDTWSLRSVLLRDVDASDATLHFDPQQRLWWMFTAMSEFDTAAWDSLSLFFAEKIDGPWHAHPSNPVKLDARSSRPAGPLVRWDGHLLRPAQDCSRGYGGAITWCEIEELTPERFRETVVGRLGREGRYRGLHTYSQAAGFEVVDFARKRWKIFGHWLNAPNRGWPPRELKLEVDMKRPILHGAAAPATAAGVVSGRDS